MSASDVCSQQGAIQTHVYRLPYDWQTDGRRHIPKHNVDTLHTIPCSSRNLETAFIGPNPMTSTSDRLIPEIYRRFVRLTYQVKFAWLPANLPSSRKRQITTGTRHDICNFL